MRLRSIALLSFFLSVAHLCFSQCEVITPSVNPKNNMFTTEMEYELGELSAEHDASSLRLMDTPALTSYLNQIGQRIAKKLPPNDIKFRFYVVDEGYANAWAYPGGRIYFTRKLISFVKTEDELAAVLAHEMGHQIVHHSALTYTRIFRNVINVNSLKTRADVEAALDQYFDVYRRKGAAAGDDNTEKEQLQADNIAVQAMAAAGYNPKAAVQFWDRFTNLKGKKGNFFTDLIGSTTDESKRLREFVNAANTLPETCVAKSESNADAFAMWQALVRSYSGSGRVELIQHPVVKKQLQPPLRAEIDFLRFSSDGKYVIAQDEASIYVLTREPFTTIMRVDAEEAYEAQFTPDNKGFVFYTRGLRVEHWNIESRELVSVEEVHALRGCMQSRLSPDGKVLACLEPSETYIPLQLTLYDTAENSSVFTKKAFLGNVDGGMQSYNWYLYFREHEGNLIGMNFSPDSHYFVAAKFNGMVAFDLTTRKETSLQGSIKKVLPSSFAFLGPDRIIGVEGDKGEKSTVLKFPSGEAIMTDIPVGNRWLTAPGHGDYVLVRPLQKAPVGILDLSQKRITIGNKNDALDIWDGIFVSERVSGELVLMKDPTAGPIAVTQLPLGPLGRVHAISVSPDQKYFALSERKRGAVWDLESGTRVMYIKGFRGVEFDGSSMYVDFPSDDDYVPPLVGKQREKDVTKERLELPGHVIVRLGVGTNEAIERDKFLRKSRVVASAPYLFVMEADKPEEEWDKNVTVTVRDLRTGSTLWTKRFSKKVPRLIYQPGSEHAVLTWDLSESAVKDETKDDAEARQKLDSLKEDFQGSYFVEVVELRTGKVTAKFPVDTGRYSFWLRDAAVYGNNIFLEDSLSRVFVYNLQGKREARFYGLYLAASRDGSYLATSAGRGRVNIYDVRTKQRIDQLVFDSRIAHASFIGGKRLLVLTKDQSVYDINLDAAVASNGN
jgi:WD40 repeat protein